MTVARVEQALPTTTGTSLISAEEYPPPDIDPDKNQVIVCVGRKGSGKSYVARWLFRNWPNVDKLVIDPSGDADPGDDLGTVTFRHKLPASIPSPTRERPFTVSRFVPDPTSPTYLDDLDRSLALALFPKNRRVLVWVDEMGEVFPSTKVSPYARMILQQGRHYYASMILCGPRILTVKVEVLAQADYVFIFDLPAVPDRKRLAETIGIPFSDLEAALNAVRGQGEHWFLIYVAHEHALYMCPPIPKQEDYKHVQQ